jgi:hypothetical protein
VRRPEGQVSKEKITGGEIRVVIGDRWNQTSQIVTKSMCFPRVEKGAIETPASVVS